MNRDDRNRIKQAVIDVLQNYNGELLLPIPIKKIIKQLPNVRLIPYSKQMRSRSMSYEEMLSFAETDDACADYYEKHGYIIYYNDIDNKKISSNRYRWNIAHELGHIVLNHHKNFNESRIFRNSLSDTTYKQLEAEADMFAAYILVPHIVLNCLMVKEDYQIAEICKVSDTASLYRSSNIKIWMQRGKTSDYDYAILGLFSDFVERNHLNPKVKEWLLARRICNFCGYPLNDFLYRYCPNCRTSVKSLYKARGNTVQYPGIKLDEDNRAIECPVCRNTDLYDAGDLCIICGHSLVNVCSDAVNADIFSPRCSHRESLPGNARHCPFCGTGSTFFVKGYLTSWNGEAYSSELDGELPF